MSGKSHAEILAEMLAMSHDGCRLCSYGVGPMDPGIVARLLPTAGGFLCPACKSSIGYRKVA